MTQPGFVSSWLNKLIELNLTCNNLIFQNLVSVEGNESLIMRNDTKNVDEAGEMKRTLLFSSEGITEVYNSSEGQR